MNLGNIGCQHSVIGRLGTILRRKQPDRCRWIIQICAFNNKSLQNKTKTESNYQSYAKKFFKFIEENYIEAKTEDGKDKCKEYNYPPLSAGDQAVLSGKEGELYLPNILRTKFKSRLRCQDRTSGDKIWLPLRFIGKIYSEAKKANKNNDENNLFLEWLDNLVKSIYIHYYKDPNSHQVESIQFNDNVSLWLRRNEDEDDYFDVYVNTNTNSLNDYCPVLTPTGKGNQKIQMTVKSISDIAIDHVKSIDSTLRDLSENPNELPLLTIVSNKYKEIQMEDEPNEKAAINELLKSEIFDLKALKKELDNISNDGILRLMSSKYNSKKSNGETFQSIIKCSEEYWGIVEKEEIIIDENDNRVYLMQNLTNTLNDKNIFRVKKTLPQGTEIKDRKDLIEIINYI